MPANIFSNILFVESYNYKVGIFNQLWSADYLWLFLYNMEQ